MFGKDLDLDAGELCTPSVSVAYTSLSIQDGRAGDAGPAGGLPGGGRGHHAVRAR
jgi:hypothetical protein